MTNYDSPIHYLNDLKADSFIWKTKLTPQPQKVGDHAVECVAFEIFIDRINSLRKKELKSQLKLDKNLKQTFNYMKNHLNFGKWN